MFDECIWLMKYLHVFEIANLDPMFDYSDMHVF